MKENSQVDPEQEAKQAEKDTKKTLESYYEVAKHRMGRAPTPEEVLRIMSESKDMTKAESEHPQSEQVMMPNEQAPEGSEEDSEGSGCPSILDMKVYHGMKDGVPDASKILFYEDTDGDVFDTANQEWMDGRPDYIDHLHSRPIQNDETDIIAAIAHGVMGDDDFDTLDKAGMIGSNSKKLWELKNKLQGQIEQLEQSQAGDFDEGLEKSEDFEEDDEIQSDDSSMEYSESDQEVESNGDDEELAGEDHLSEIVQSAMAAALAGPHLEATIRAIVRQEMGKGAAPEAPSVVVEEENEESEENMLKKSQQNKTGPDGELTHSFDKPVNGKNSKGHIVGTVGETGTHTTGGVHRGSSIIPKTRGGVMVLVSSDLHAPEGDELRFSHENDARKYLDKLNPKTPKQKNDIPF